MKKLRQERINREEFVKIKKEYRKWCEEERKKHEEKVEEKIKQIRIEQEA